MREEAKTCTEDTVTIRNKEELRMMVHQLPDGVVLRIRIEEVMGGDDSCRRRRKMRSGLSISVW